MKYRILAIAGASMLACSSAATAVTARFPLPPLIRADADLSAVAQPDELPESLPGDRGVFTPVQAFTLSFSGTVTRSLGDPDPLGEIIALDLDASLREGKFRLGGYESVVDIDRLYLDSLATRDLVDPYIAFEMTLYDFPTTYSGSIPPSYVDADGNGFFNAVVRMGVQVDGMLPFQEEFFSCTDYPDYAYCGTPIQYTEGAVEVSRIGFNIVSFESEDDVEYDNPLTPFYDPDIGNVDLPVDLFPGAGSESFEILRAQLEAFSADFGSADLVLGGADVTTPVPVPASLPLLGAGALMLGFVRRSRG